MEFTGVYHKTSEQFSYAQNEEGIQEISVIEICGGLQ